MPFDPSPKAAGAPDQALPPSSRPVPAGIAVELQAVADRLADPFGQAESALLAIGDRLGQAVDGLGRLTPLFEALPRQLEHDDVQAATAHLAEIARHLAGMTDTLDEERLALEQLADLAEDGTGRIGQLAQTVGAIGVLAINARIAAAQVEGQGEDLSAFTGEIGRLAQAAAATIKAFAADHGRLVTLLRTARSNQANFVQRHAGTLAQLVRRLDAGLGQVADRRRQASDLARTIGQRAAEIGRAVAAAVTALQIGDITRQRAEHVGQALALLAAGLQSADGAEWSAALDAGQRRTVVATVCRLQSAQLAQTVNEFDQELRQALNALGRLAAEARDIVRLGAEAYGAGGTKGNGTGVVSGGSFLSMLADDLRQAYGLIQECEAARAEVDRIAGAASASLDALLGRVAAVQRIEIDMRLVGLNTAFRCGRLGERGRTLIVIAQELRGYANRTVEDSRVVVAGLREIAGLAETLNGQARARGAGSLSTLDQATARALDKLEASGAGLARALDSLAEDGGRVAALLSETAANVTVDREVGTVLHDAMGRLGRIAAATAGDAGRAETVKADILARIGGRYTMASERAIHALFTGHDAAPPHPAATASATGAEAASAEPDIDDLLF